MKKIGKIICGWLGFITLPYLIRRCLHDEEFTGHLSMLNTSSDTSIGYFVIPGLVPPSNKIFREVFKPQKYDLNLIRFGRKDYDLDLAAQKIAEHIKCMNYKKVRIITFAMGDHILAFLNHYLSSYIKREALEIVVINPVPHQEFISHKYRDYLKLIEPVLIFGRVLSGWVAELPFIRRLGHWYSPAEVIEPLCNLSGYDYDYTEDEISEDIVAVIKDRHVFYEPSNVQELYSVTFNWDEDDEAFCPIYYTSNHNSNLQNEDVARQYKRIFDILNWTF